MLRDCSDNVRKMFYIKFMFVHSLTTFLLSLYDILHVTFLASNEVNYIEEAHVKLSLILKLADAVVLRNEFDSTILEQCEQRGLLHFETEPQFTVLGPISSTGLRRVFVLKHRTKFVR